MSKTAGDSTILLATFQDNYNSGIYDEAEIVYLGATSAGTRLLIRRHVPNTRRFSNQTLLITDLTPATSTETLADGLAASLLGSNVRAFSYAFDGTNWKRIRSSSSASDQLAPTAGLLTSLNFLFVKNGGFWDGLRTPGIFKTADASAAGNTTVWTPAAGKKFRLMRLLLTVDGACTLTVAGSELITFTDSGTAIGVGFRVALSNAAVTSDTDIVIPYDMGNGYLSTTADNVLQVNLGTALAAGNIRVSVMGTEE